MRIDWQFSETEWALITSKSKKTRLYYALQLKHYATHDHFLSDFNLISSKTRYQVAKRLGVSGRINIISAKTQASYRQEIRSYCQASVISAETETLIKEWLLSDVLPHTCFNLEQLKEKTIAFLNQKKIEAFSESTLKRILKSARHGYEERLFANITEILSAEAKAYLDGLLLSKDNGSSYFSWIKHWPGGLALKTILEEADKLKFIRTITLPECIEKIPNKTLQQYYRNICTKYPCAIKEMPESHRYALLAIFVWVRMRQIADNLADLLIRLIHKFVSVGKRKLINELSDVTTIKRACSLKQLLRLLIATIISNEDKVIKNAIYPVTPKIQLQALLDDESNIDYSYTRLVHERARNSYLHHYRGLLEPILALLDFRSNNTAYQPIITALKLIQSNLHSRAAYYPEDVVVPIEGAIKSSHQKLVIDQTEQGTRVNRINYEMCVPRNLRSKLRVKEVWIDQSQQYRNPEEDLPQDFEENRDYYCGLLGQPKEVSSFISSLKRKLTQHLQAFNKGLSDNKQVQILKKPLGHIKVAKLKEQAPAVVLEKIKSAVFKRWPNTSLLDILKETDLFVDLLGAFTPSGPKEGLDKDSLRKRLLLCILGYGTNTGLKNISTGNEECSYHELKHVKLRYFDPDNLREAIRRVVNQLFTIRSSQLWGTCTTAVASDSTLFEAADQNLLSQWHPRYHKTGVMVYWHVDTCSAKVVI